MVVAAVVEEVIIEEVIEVGVGIPLEPTYSATAIIGSGGTLKVTTHLFGLTL